MKTADYWKKRFEALESVQHKNAQKTYYESEREIAKAQREIEDQINSWYGRFAENNEITLTEARQWLNKKELEEFKWDVDEYIKRGKENAVNQKWMKELENASARFHISKLEALKIQTQNTLETLFGNQVDKIDSLIKQTYLNGYYHTAFEIQRGTGIGWDIAGINECQLEKIINKPWTTDGNTFSDRIWTQKDRLVNEVHTRLTQDIILGKAPDESIKEIATKFNTSKSNASRLIMTESAQFSNLAQIDAYKELGVEMIMVVGTLDGITCTICGDMDGKIFKLSEAEPGVTIPVFHPNCRCVTIPHFEDNFAGERAARGEDGKTYYVPADTTFEEWKDKTATEDNKKHTTQNNTLTNQQDDVNIFTDKLKTNNINDQGYIKTLSDKFAVGTDDAKKALLKFVPDGSVANGAYTGTPNYSVADKKVRMNFNMDALNTRGVGVTYFHEHGHLIDDRPKGQISSDNKFIQSLRDDYNNLIIKETSQHKGWSKRQVEQNIADTITGKNNTSNGRQHLYSSVSDILGGLSTRKHGKGYMIGIKDGWNHKPSYWARKPNFADVESEAFAHLFEAQFDAERLKAFREYFPTAVNEFERILKGVV